MKFTEEREKLKKKWKEEAKRLFEDCKNTKERQVKEINKRKANWYDSLFFSQGHL